MSIIKEISKESFVEKYLDFNDIKENLKIERDKAGALYEYLNSLSDDIGENINLDFIDFNLSYNLYHIDEIDEMLDYYSDFIDKLERFKNKKTLSDRDINKICDILNYYTSCQFIDNVFVIATF